MARETASPISVIAEQCAMLPHGISYFLREAGSTADDWARVLTALFPQGSVTVRCIEERETLLIDQDDEARVYVILTGAFDEFRLGVRAAIRRPGHLLGALPLLSDFFEPKGACQRDVLPGGREGSEIRSRVRSTVLTLPGPALLSELANNQRLTRALLDTLAEHAADYLDDADQYDEAFEQYFPGRSGMLTPAPYDVASARMRIFFCAPPVDQPEALQAMVPPCAHWHPMARMWLLVFAEMRGIAPRFHPSASFDYDEISAFVPIRRDFGLMPYFHVPFMFPDNIMAIYMGREIFGLPKRRSSNFFDTLDDGRERVLMRRMLPEEVRRQLSAARPARGDRRTKEVDVLDARYRGVGRDDEVAALRDELLPALLPHIGLPALHAVFKLLGRGNLSASLLDLIGGKLPAQPCATATRLANEYLEKVPEVLRSIPVTAWKRIFAPDAMVKDAGPQTWHKRDFEVDGLAMTPFPIQRVERLGLIRLEGNEPLWSSPGFPVLRPQPISSIGLRVDVRMSLAPGRHLHDYRTSPGSDRRRLDWGPMAGDSSTFG